MTEHHFHLLQVKVRPHAYIKDVISGCWRYVQDGMREKGTIVHGFKIVGENRMVFSTYIFFKHFDICGYFLGTFIKIF